MKPRLPNLVSPLLLATLVGLSSAAEASKSADTATTLPQRVAPAVIDDSATVVLDPAPKMNWRTLSPKSRDNAIIGRTRVNVKLNTSPWLGKKAKIYMVMPAETAGTMALEWRSSGTLQDGKLKSGGRTLVYNGVIRNPRMEDIFDVEIEADGTRVSQTQQLRISYEIEVE